MNQLNKINITRIFLLVVLFLSNVVYSIPSEKAELLFSHTRGFYYNNFTLQIFCDIPTSRIRYTVDGSNPLTSSNAVVGNSPIQISIDPTNTSSRDVAPGFIQ
jgi:hypothetical protein